MVYGTRLHPQGVMRVAVLLVDDPGVVDKIHSTAVVEVITTIDGMARFAAVDPGSVGQSADGVYLDDSYHSGAGRGLQCALRIRADILLCRRDIHRDPYLRLAPVDAVGSLLHWYSDRTLRNLRKEYRWSLPTRVACPSGTGAAEEKVAGTAQYVWV
jgi:hypothetical protein